MNQPDSNWNSNQNDRRASARLVGAVKLSIADHSHGAEAEVINISLNGLLCRLPKNIPLMTQVELTLLLPGPTSAAKPTRLITRGVIVRTEKREMDYLIAIYFADLNTSSKNQLTSYLDENTSPDIDQLR